VDLAIEPLDSVAGVRRSPTRSRPASGCHRLVLVWRLVRALLALSLAFAFAPIRTWAEAPQRTLRLGYFPNLTHAQALYARATGAFNHEGSEIRWTAFMAGPTAIEALFTDEIDATFVGPSPTINGYVRSNGKRFVVIAGGASGGAGLVVRRDSGIVGDGDFDGKTIATPQLGNTQDVAARLWLGARGYRLRERGGGVSLVPLSNADQLTMFKKRQIHGAWTVEPWMARLEVEGGGRVFLEEKTLWPGERFVTTHLVVNKTFVADHPDLLRDLISDLVQVTQSINSNKTAAASILNEQLRRETGKPLAPEVIRKALQRVEFTWDPLCSTLETSAVAACSVGFLKRSPDLRGLYLLSLLNGVLKDRGLATVAGPRP
jgi:NitT/TauT family transport system substrate-binding protein